MSGYFFERNLFMIIKNIVDFVYNCIKEIEEVLSADSVVLKMKRSVQLIRRLLLFFIVLFSEINKSKIIDLISINSIYFVAHIPQILSWHLYIVENILLPGMT